MAKGSIDLTNSAEEGAANGFENRGYNNDEGFDSNMPKQISTISGSEIVGVDEPEEETREQWSKPIEFLLSCIAMSVGLGNIWRFPFTAFENGGGAFLIPYLIVLFFIGKPIYFLELAIGQFSSYGQVKVWRMVPFFKGIGYGSMVGTACVVSYYCSLMALTVFYFFASFNKNLPWSECNEDWAGEGNCNGTSMANELANKSIPEVYFEKEVLKQYDHVNDGIGMPEWRLTLCLLFSWIVIFASLVKGVSGSGKVAYFTALFPYVVLIILLIRGVTLEGAGKGILYFIEPKWGEILKPKVWYAAVGQCFFSLSTGFGPIIMFASYNPFKHNVYRDAMIISLMDTFTSLLAGFTIFAILGNLAHELDTDIESVAKGGPGLAFISYPDAISKFDFVPQLFAVLFFLMLFTLGVGSATSLAGGIITIIHDQWPKIPRWQITSLVCGSLFLVGLIYVTPGGQFMLTLVDYFGANFVIYVMATVEVIGIAWVYGLNNICLDIEFMLDVKVSWYWKFCWGFFIPVGLTVILFYSLITSETLTHNDEEFPAIAIACGWIISAVALILLPICAIHSIRGIKKPMSFKEKILESFRPKYSWGPKSKKTRREWEEFKAKRQ